MDRVIKNFYYYDLGVAFDRLTWKCPELVGHYKMKILMMTLGSAPNPYYSLNINSSQILSPNLNSYPISNPYNLQLDFINFINVGFCNNSLNRYICGDLVADVLMNGQFDFMLTAFNTTYTSGGRLALRFERYATGRMCITAEFKKVKDEIPRILLSSEKKRFILNATSPPSDYFTDTSNFSISDYRLRGRFRCKLIFNCCLTGFPENTGAYLLSPQFDINTRYYFSIGENIRRDSYGYAPTGYIGNFYGSFNFTTYANRTQAIEAMQACVFTWEFEEL